MAYGNNLYFEEPYWLSMFLMGIIGLAIRALSLMALYIISNPKKIKLLPPENQPENIPPMQNMQQNSLESAKPIINPSNQSNIQNHSQDLIQGQPTQTY
jgi:hypothetical protein